VILFAKVSNAIMEARWLSAPKFNLTEGRDKAIKRLNNEEAYFGITLQPPQKSGVGTSPPWLS
jgi:hypothetical protein